MEALIIGTVVVMLIGLSLQGTPAPQRPPTPPVVYVPVVPATVQANEESGGSVWWILFLVGLVVVALLYGVPAI